MIIPVKFNTSGVMLLEVNGKAIAAVKSKNMIETIKQLKEDKRMKRFEGQICPRISIETEVDEEWFIWLRDIDTYDEIEKDLIWMLSSPEWIIPGELIRNGDKILRVVDGKYDISKIKDPYNLFYPLKKIADGQV